MHWVSHWDTPAGGNEAFTTALVSLLGEPSSAQLQHGSRTAHPSHEETLRASIKLLERHKNTAHENGASQLYSRASTQHQVQLDPSPSHQEQEQGKVTLPKTLLLSQIKQDLIRGRATQAIKGISEAFKPGGASNEGGWG